MKTLPKLSEYILRFRENTDGGYSCHLEYCKFITQPLNLSHFVPAIEKDGKWIVLEKYIKTISEEYWDNNSIGRVFSKEEVQYQKALDNVVFKGWHIDFRDSLTIIISDANDNIIEFKENGDIYIFDEFLVKSIEDAIFYSERENINLEVNETIIKKFGL